MSRYPKALSNTAAVPLKIETTPEKPVPAAVRSMSWINVFIFFLFARPASRQAWTWMP
jgi:hypothetical protein